MASKDTFPVVFFPLLLGIYAAFQVFRLKQLRTQTVSWLRTRGFIREAKVIGWGKGQTASVIYEYFTPDTRIGSQICPYGCEVNDRRIYLRRYPVGKEVDVFFDPQAPHMSFLELPSSRVIKAWQTMTTLGLVFPIVYLIWVQYLAD